MPNSVYKRKYMKTFSFYPEKHLKIKNISKDNKITQLTLVEMGIDNMLMSFEMYGKEQTFKNFEELTKKYNKFKNE